MPHIPRQSEPAKQPGLTPHSEREGLKPVSKHVGLGSINLHTWEVDPGRVYQHLTGTEAKRDEFTGCLVPAKPPAAPGAAGPPGGPAQHK